MRLPIDWRMWLVMVAILAGLGTLIVWTWIDDDEPRCFPATACVEIPEDELR